MVSSLFLLLIWRNCDHYDDCSPRVFHIDSHVAIEYKSNILEHAMTGTFRLNIPVWAFCTL